MLNRKIALVLGISGLILANLASTTSFAQSAPKPSSPDANELARQGIDYVSRGDCKRALPTLKRAIPHLTDKQLRYSAEMASVRCAMSINDVDTAVEGLIRMNHEYQHDPEVLYVTAHFFSELANRASSEIAATQPSSYQAHELDAEAYESQGKWDEATAEYKQILEKNPNLPGIHYRLGRILLVRPEAPGNIDEAKKEFEAELRIDPSNASSEYALGEIARQSQQWEEAEGHYLNAAKDDQGFLEAFLGLGMSLNALGRFPDAVPPLEKYVKFQPADPAGHYQLAIAYARTGRKQDADREMELQRQTEAKVVQGAQRTPEKVIPQQ
ncbi:MAG TPA: tetratricopeptide repeat protein [Candidatus Acidoferrales bacterium]|nr:tetratricopeptide repeat protein [Candidatus Acidoferrales bacterium]